MDEITIIDINNNNISEYPPRCFLKPDNEGYKIKVEWLKKRFSEGMKIKQLYVENEKKAVSFIEYVPGEYAWRAVNAKDYMFIHCMWTSANKYKSKGYSSLLINECTKDAEKQGMSGVAVVTSEGPFMTGKDLFIKNGFTSVVSEKPSFELMVKNIKQGPAPQFRDWQKQLKSYEGLNIVYTNQCPWVARSIPELKEIAQKNGFKLKITELKNAKDAQNAPSIYASFNLIYDGKLLVDHYISSRRFENIIKKEIK